MLRRLTHMLSCKEASRLLSQRQDRPLTLGERTTVRLIEATPETRTVRFEPA